MHVHSVMFVCIPVFDSWMLQVNCRQASMSSSNPIQCSKTPYPMPITN